MSLYIKDKPDEIDRALSSLKIKSFSFSVFLAVDGQISEQQKKIIKKYQDINTFEVFKFEESLGLTTRLYELMNIAKERNFKYVFRMDTDDECINNRLHKQYQFMQKNLDIGVSSSFAIEDWSGEEIKRKFPIKHNEILNEFKFRNPIKHSSVCIRLSSIPINQNYNKYFKKCQDRIFWTDLMKEGVKFEIIPEFLIKYYYDKDLFMRRRTKEYVYYHFLSQLYSIRILYKFSLNAYVFLVLSLFSKSLPIFLLKKLYKKHI